MEFFRLFSCQLCNIQFHLMLISNFSLRAFNLNFIFQRALAEIDSGNVQRHGRQTLQIALRRPFQHRAFLSLANSTEDGMKVVFACNSVSLLLILTPHQQISTGEKAALDSSVAYTCRRKDKDLLALLAWIMQTLFI